MKGLSLRKIVFGSGIGKPMIHERARAWQARRPATGLAVGDDERFIRKLEIGEALQIVEGPAGAGAL
jgi:hypothetical protein